VTVFDAKAAKVLGTVKCVEGSIHSLAFLPGTEGVVVAGRGTLARIDIPAMKPAWTVVGHKVEILISRILIDKVSNLVISCSHDGTARVWEVGTGKKVAILRHSGGVSGAAISPDGKSLFTHGAENRLWDTNSWTVRKDLPDGEGHIVKSKFSPDGQCVLAIGTDGFVRIWKAENGEIMETLNPNSQRLLDFLLCEGGSEIIVCGDAPECQVWSRSS
jgi:WD40 repeat protein